MNRDAAIKANKEKLQSVKDDKEKLKKINPKRTMFEIVDDKEEGIEEKIENFVKNDVVIEYAYILHDQDKNNDDTPKHLHYHLVFKLKNARSRFDIANLYGGHYTTVSIIKSYPESIRYLTHINAPEKYQYSRDLVISSFNYSEFVDDLEKKYQARIASASHISNIIDQIVSGFIREYELVNFVSVQEYIKYKKQFDLAFSYRRQTLLNNHNRRLTCYYVYGASGVGKTTIAKYICERNGFKPFISSGTSDPLGDYRGERAIILDDSRGNGFNVSDILKLTDPFTRSAFKSRYHDKVIDSDLLILTSSRDIETFFNNLEFSAGESIVQLKRRFFYNICISDTSISFSYFDKSSNGYIFSHSIDNILSSIIPSDSSVLTDFSKVLEPVFVQLGDLSEFEDVFTP